MALKWDMNDKEMRAKLKEARQIGHSRLFAIAYDSTTPVQWHYRKDEAEMKRFLDSRERSESILFNCAIAIAVVNPQDSDDTIGAALSAGRKRADNGPGYFDEAF